MAGPVAPGSFRRAGRGVPRPYARRRGLGDGYGRSRGHVVDELEVGHLGRVALTRPDLHDSRIAARAVGEARRHLREEQVRDRLRAQEGDRLAVSREIAPLAEADHLLDDRAHLLRLRLGRLDAAVLDERRGEVGVERLPVRRVAAELPPRLTVPHAAYSSRRFRPCAESVSRTSSIDFLPKFGIAASSLSVFVTRSPIVSMPTRLRQL